MKVAQLLTGKTTKRTLILLFLVTGALVMALRYFYFNSPNIYPEDSAWKVSLIGQFNTLKDATRINAMRPRPGRFHRLVSQRLYHPNLKVLVTKQPGKRKGITALALKTGKTDLLVEFHLQLSQSPLNLVSNKDALTPEDRETYLKSSTVIDISLKEISSLNKVLEQGSDNKPALLEKIFQHSQKPLKSIKPRHDHISQVISSNKATSLGRARLMVALCRINSIPARVVTGFILEENRGTTPYYWVEVYDEEKHWLAYDPERGFDAAVPPNYIAFGYDRPEVFQVTQGRQLVSRFEITEDLDILNVERLKHEHDFMDVLELRRLDFETRQALVLLLILPFCVLMTAFIRHVLGFFPYGTFTAPLLALAMVYADKTVTLIIAGIVIFLALLGRGILPKTLPRTPRLSLIFTFVALGMVLSVSVMAYFSINPGGKIILLPVIILVAVVDRFYSYMDEASTHAALIRLGVTVMIAIVCIPILEFEMLGNFILRYPEFHLVTAALVLMFSSYSGKKLTDYTWLKLFGENKTLKQKSTKKRKVKSDKSTSKPETEGVD